ncbi:Uncharacterised protein [uncultured archaeon]|nr:Uncharacterised protein [uncultured archaeon]
MSSEKASVEEQKVYLCFLLSDSNLYPRSQNIFNPQNFDRSLQKAARFIQEHTQEHSTLPTFQQVNAIGGLELEPISGINEGHEQWFLKSFESFTKREELERAIIKSADLIGRGEFDPVEKLVKDAVEIGLTKDLGIDYFHDPRARLLRLKDKNGMVSTGWKTIDDKLFGGFNIGGLNIFCGNSGAGKSLFLQNLALNWMEKNLNGIYITLELSEDLVAMRLDSMVSGIASREIFHNLDNLEIKLAMAKKRCGSLKIKYMPAQTSINQIKAYIKELSIQKNYHPDFVCIDYLDLIMPSSMKVDIENVFLKDKLCSEELRNYATEQKNLMVTASQFNRTGIDEIELSAGSISGGISKFFTADTLFGIYTNRSMRERGAIQLQFLKTRNSNGVDSKIDLAFDVNTMRISDMAEEVVAEKIISGADIVKQIREKKDGKKVEPLPTSQDVSRDKLNNLLASLNKK